jgi:hypothetical protein
VLLLPCTHEALSALFKGASRGGKHPFVVLAVERLQRWLNRQQEQQIPTQAATAPSPFAPLLGSGELPEQSDEEEEDLRAMAEVRSDRIVWLYILSDLI